MLILVPQLCLLPIPQRDAVSEKAHIGNLDYNRHETYHLTNMNDLKKVNPIYNSPFGNFSRGILSGRQEAYTLKTHRYKACIAI